MLEDDTARDSAADHVARELEEPEYKPGPTPENRARWPEEVLTEMRRLGLPRPEGCPVSLWKEPPKINHRYEAVIELMLAGWKKNRIAAELGHGPQYMNDITNSPRFKAALAEARAQRNDSINRKILQPLFGDAVYTIEQLMKNDEEKGSTRLSAATYLVDQLLGKAKSEVEVKGSLLAEFLARADSMEMRDVTEPEELDTAAHPIDDFMKDHLPDGFVVGKRTGASEESA